MCLTKGSEQTEHIAAILSFSGPIPFSFIKSCVRLTNSPVLSVQVSLYGQSVPSAAINTPSKPFSNACNIHLDLMALEHGTLTVYTVGG